MAGGGGTKIEWTGKCLEECRGRQNENTKGDNDNTWGIKRTAL
jgi:hypothetical protein